MMRRRLRYPLIATGVPLLLISALLHGLLFTEAGLGWAAERVQGQHQLGDTELTVRFEQVQGSLAAGFEIDDLQLITAATNIKIGRVELAWQPLQLFRGKLDIQQLRLWAVSGSAGESEEPENPSSLQLTGFSSPVGIDIGVLQITEIQWRLADQQPIQIDQIDASAALDDSLLSLRQFSVSSARGQFSLQGTVDLALTDNAEVDLSHQFSWQLTDQGLLDGKAQIGGNWSELDIQASTAAPYASALNGHAESILTADRRWQLEAQLDQMSLDFLFRMGIESGSISANLDEAMLSGEFSLEQTGSAHYVLDTQLDFSIPQLSVTISSDIAIDDQLLSIRQLDIIERSDFNAGHLSLSGAVENYPKLFSIARAPDQATGTGDASERLDLRANWANLSTLESLLGSPLSSPSGSILIEGTLDNYRIGLEAELNPISIPYWLDSSPDSELYSGQLVARGSGSLQQLRVDQLELSGELGKGSGLMSLGWGELIHWQAEFELEGFRPELLFAAWPGQISTQVITSGTYRDSNLDASLQLQNLSGELIYLPLAADIDLQISNELINIQTLEASLGESQLAAKGLIGASSSDLSWNFSLLDLSQFSAGLSGSLESRGALRGSLKAPAVSAEFNAKNLAFQSWRVAGLTGDINLNLDSASEQWNGYMALQDLDFKDQRFVHSGEWQLSGSAEKHQISVLNKLVADAEQSARISGSWSDQRWQAVVAEFNVDIGDRHQWRLSAPTELLISAPEKSLTHSCVRNQIDQNTDQSICASAQQGQDTLSGKLALQHMPASILDTFLAPYGLAIRSQLNAELEFRMPDADPALLVASGELSSDLGSVMYRQDSNPASELAPSSQLSRPLDKQLDYSNLQINFDHQQQLALHWNAVLETSGFLHGELRVDQPLFSNEFQQAAISARLDAQIPDISVLSALRIGELDLAGTLEAAATMDGTVAEPSLAANFAIADGLVKLPELGMELSQLDLRISSQPDSRASIRGSAQSGTGVYDLAGEISLQNLSAPSGVLELTGDNVQLVQTKSIYADGDLSLTLSLEQNNIDISGELNIDSADVVVGNQIGIVSESSDLVFEEAANEDSSISTSMDILVDLGENTHISANGLTGILVGTPRIKRSRRGLLTSSGDISILNGKYSAYGQNLSIDRGQASYAGGDLDSPELIVDATRTINDEKVGISVRGPADKPEVSLFSDPTMSDQNILSMLVFGKKVDQLSSSDGLKLLSIANSLRGGGAASQMNQLTDRISNYFGLDSISFDLNSAEQNQALSISSQISSKLDVGYAYSFISSLHAVFVRYKINDNWSIQSNFDVDSGADFRYQIEKD